MTLIFQIPLEETCHHAIKLSVVFAQFYVAITQSFHLESVVLCAGMLMKPVLCSL
jgi:hypothetical protein